MGDDDLWWVDDDDWSKEYPTNHPFKSGDDELDDDYEY